MLRITASGASAKSYYTRADYYSERGESQESPGVWGGKLAERLGLRGVVDKERFEQLVDNISPITEKSLTPRTKGERRSGYDFTFDLSKKTSIYYSMTKDERVMACFDSAVEETMAELERDTRTRVRKGGACSERLTGEMVWANFYHGTARPVDGVPEPHCHRHVFVFNCAFDHEENRFKAIEIGAIKRDATYYQESFHSRVASKLRAAGINTERDSSNYDLAGLDRSLTDRFSSRTRVIEQAARERGIDSATAKGQLGARTRSSKATDYTMSELREVWDTRITAEERRAFGTIARGQAKASTPDVSAAQAVDWAIEHCFARESVTSLPRFTAEALRHSLGSATVEQVKAEIDSRPEILTREIDGRVLCSTVQVMREEKAMIAYASEGRGTRERLVSPSQAIADGRLSDEQRAAVKFAWASTDSVILIRGAAGTGKTTLMKEIVRGIEAEGGKVFACAPSADASRGVQRSEGFASADTLARLLHDERLQETLRGSVLWLDEGGLAGVRSLNALFALAERLDSRIIITGDVAQHGPVDRGDGLSILEKNSGCRSASIVQVRRQVNAEYRAAALDLSEGRTDSAFDRLEKLGFIKEAGADRHQLLAHDYLQAIDDRKSVLVIAPTHRECEAVTQAVRVGLRERGKLQGEDRPFVSLKNTHATVAELRDPVTYREGQYIAFTRHAPGLKRGERLQVVGHGPDGSVQVQRADGETLPLPLQYADRFNRYESRVIGLAVGDKIRISQNGYDQSGKRRLDNGSTYQVAGFTRQGDIKLANDWIIPKDFGHVTHGVATTSHGSQGKTVDRILLAQGGESFTASNREQFYVSVSRGKESVTIYTDSKELLREAVRGSGRRLSATEVFQHSSDPSRSHADLNARLRTHAETAASRSAEELRERYGEAQLVVAAREPQVAEAGYER